MVIDDKIKSHFLNLYSIALTDTQVDAKELEFLFEMGKERGIPKEEIHEIILRPDLVKYSVPHDTLEKMEYLYDFARMAWSNEEIDEYERIALQKFCKKFGFLEENIEGLVDFLLNEAKKGTSKDEFLITVKNHL